MMGQSDSGNDYYDLLGINDDASRAEIEKQYKREAAKHHPDRGGSEERMKSLNEAYSVLRNESSRREYDEKRRGETTETRNIIMTSAPARDVGVFGHGLSALLCLITGAFLLLLVRFQWIWFLWPLAILALFVIGFGVLMARSAMIAANSTLPTSNFLRRYYGVQEVAFWIVVVGVAYGFYWVMGQ